MVMEQTPPGIGEGPAKVISVSLPEGTVHALRELVGSRGVSRVVASAVEEHLHNQVAAAYLAEYEAENGPFSEDEQRAAAEVWAEAESKEAKWPAAG